MTDDVLTMDGQTCPMCAKATLTLSQAEREVPYFGSLLIFSMDCSSCKFHQADVEASQQQEPAKWTMEISSEDDLSVRVVKSSEATVKIPHMMSIEPGPASNGYITNIEGILNRVKTTLEDARDSEEDPKKKKKAKNQLKKLQKVLVGHESLKITIEDPSGNSAIISEKAEKKKL